MKILTYLLIIGVLCSACSDNDKNSVENKSPTVPLLISPVDAKLCLYNSVAFEWNVAVDAENDTITYEIQVASDEGFSDIVTIQQLETNTKTIELDKNLLYYWRVKAIDSRGQGSNYSAVYRFYTAGDIHVNNLPFSPELLQASIGSNHNNDTNVLEWNAVDMDQGDTLTYDVSYILEQ